MGIDLHELWQSYFSLVLFPHDDRFYETVTQFIIDREGVCLFDLKSMAQRQPFSSLFPSNNDPAFKHWEKLEAEIEKGKPVDVLNFFLKKEYEVFISEYQQRNKRYPQFKNISLSDEMIQEIIKFDKKFIFYDSKENSFKYDFTDIIPGEYKPNSIYEAFRCYVPRYYVSKYIRNPNDNVYIRKVKEGYKGNESYFIPTQKQFEKALQKTMNLQLLNGDSANIKTLKKWNYYKKMFRNVLSDLKMEEETENLEDAIRNKSFVGFISELIKDPKSRQKLENYTKKKIKFEHLEDKIGKYYEYSNSLNSKTKNENGADELLDLQEDKKFNKPTENENNVKLFNDVHLSLSDNELETIKGKWLNAFKTAFEKDEYAQNGQVNFVTNHVFKRYINWLVPFIGFYGLKNTIEETRDYSNKLKKKGIKYQDEVLNKEDILHNLKEKSNEYDVLLLLESNLFKDYCRVHALNGCNMCGITASKDSEYQAAQSKEGLTYDISKCENCLIFKDNINLLMPHYWKLKKGINRFIKLIENDGKKTIGVVI